MHRRNFLRALAAAPALGSLGALISRAADTAAEENLPPVRALTKGPRFHWFGYYDKFQFSADNRFVLANQIDFEAPHFVIEINPAANVDRPAARIAAGG